MNARPVLLLDVGLDATGIAIATLDDDGPRVRLDVFRPADQLSTAERNEKRSSTYYGDVATMLFSFLNDLMARSAKFKFAVVFAEVPTMGAQNASGMRAMSMSLAAYRCAARAANLRRVDFIRNDVIAAALGTKRVTDETKLQTRALVSKCFTVDDSALPPTKMVKHRRTVQMIPCEATEKLRDNAYDAAAVLFAARDTDALRVGAGWGDWKLDRAAIGPR